MPVYETQTRPWHGPGLSPLERDMATFLNMEVVNARRRSDREFDVEIDYMAPGQDGTTGWMPLVLLHEEWKRRPLEVGGLVEAAGGAGAAVCAEDFDFVLDLDNQDDFMAMCHGVWAIIQART